MCINLIRINFLTKSGAAANVAVITMSTNCIVHTLLNVAQHRPSWITTTPAQNFQRYEVFVDTFPDNFQFTSFDPMILGEVPSYAECHPISVTLKFDGGRVIYKEVKGGFRIYGQGVVLNPFAAGHIFMTIPESKLVYYAQLRVKSDKIYPETFVQHRAPMNPNHPMAPQSQ